MTTYVFDNSPLSVLFKNFYRSRFPTLWAQFDALVDAGRILSTREALREIEDGASDECRAWAAQNSALFASSRLHARELAFQQVARIERSEMRGHRRGVCGEPGFRCRSIGATS